MFKKITKLFEVDEDGRKNRPKIILFFAILTLPFVLLEGIKVGIYSSYNANKIGFQVLAEGLTTSFAKILQMRHQYSFGGIKTHAFDMSYALIIFLFWLIVFAISYIEAERRQRLSRIKDGDAEWANIDEYNKKFAYPQKKDGAEDPPENDPIPGNIIMSKRVRYSLEPSGTNTWSCNLIVGSTGSGKSFTFVKPNILQMNSSFVVTDPKGELLNDTGMALMRHGYDVKVFNVDPSELHYSCKYNPFAYVRSPEDIDTLIDVFLKNVKDPDAKPDAFFDSAEKNYLGALFHYVYEEYKETAPEKMTMKTVYELFLECKEVETNPRQGPAPETSFDKKFKELGARDPFSAAFGHYAIYSNGTAKTKQSILATVGNEFAFMNTATVANLLSCDPDKHIRKNINGELVLTDDLRLDLVGDRKTAIFVVIPSQEKTYNFLAAMMFSQLFRELYRIGNNINSKSWILSKGMTTALKSRTFVAGTEDEKKARTELEELQKLYQNATIEDDDESKLPKNSEGITVWAKSRIVCEQDGQKIVLEEFMSHEQAELVLDAAKNGKIYRGGKKHICHVRLILDEFFNIGKINDFDNIIATCRSLRISVDIILQSIVQLKEMYDDKEGKITSNCSNVIILGANEMEDMKWASDMIGQTTVVSESVNLDHKGLGGASGGSLSENSQLLLRPEQIRKLKTDECLIITSSQNPLKDKKYNATEHPRWKETYDSNTDETKEKTAMNQFPYRRIFYIEQEDKNRAVTARALTQTPSAATIPQKPKTAADDKPVKPPVDQMDMGRQMRLAEQEARRRDIERRKHDRQSYSTVVDFNDGNINDSSYQKFRNSKAPKPSLNAKEMIESYEQVVRGADANGDSRIKEIANSDMLSRLGTAIDRKELRINEKTKRIESVADVIDDI